MFTWICPTCGGEVPPAYDECPRCKPPKAAAPEAVDTEPPPRIPADVPAHVPADTPNAIQTPQPVTFPPPAPAPGPPPPAPAPKRSAVSPALAAAGAGIVTAVLLALLYLYVLPHRGETAVKAEAPVLGKPAQAGRGAGAHPLAKLLEVGGVRVREDKGGNAKIQFVVINHSGADLPKLQAEIRLRSGDREFFAFPVDLPSIGPYESKELSATVKTDLKPYELPDWQMVQPQFTITSEP